MQFIDLGAQQKRIRESLEANIKKVLDHGRYINGPEIKTLELKLSEYAGVKYAVGVGSGTDALLMILMGNNIGPGDAVFTSTFTFIATAEVIQLLKATPVFVDIDPKTFNIDPDKLEDTIKKVIDDGKLRPKGIIPVDLFGQLADYDEANRIAGKYGLFVLEDAAQSFGASYRGKKSCSFADFAATSFFPAKPLGCYGDGGMIFTDNEAFYNKLISIREHGKGVDKYNNIRVGINGRIDTIQAAVLLSKFEIFDEEISLRQKVAQRYNMLLKDVRTVPFIKEHNVSAWAQYSVLLDEREKIINSLRGNDIPSAVYYPKPLHLQTAFSNLGYSKGAFPVAEKVANNILSLPMHPYISKGEQDLIVKTITNGF